MEEVNVIHSLDDEVLFVENIRAVKELASMRSSYNSIVHCRSGRILVEVGGNLQVKVLPGQLLLIPAGKLVEPMLISTDVDANALLVNDRILKSVLGNQINIWNKAMYMKEIYVVEGANWLDGFHDYANSLFKDEQTPMLSHEIIESFLRTMLLMVCEELLCHEKMDVEEDNTSFHDKNLFNQFLQLLSCQSQKRQRVSFYANQLNVTPKYLSSVTKKVSGKNPMRWISESVMQDCYSLLKDTEMSVKEISNQLGFPNSSFFSQYFREQSGQTPKEYRMSHKKMVR